MAQGGGTVVTTPWAVRLPRMSVRAAGALRLTTGVRVAEAVDALWLRGDDLTETLDLELRKLPGALRYAINSDERVTEFGRRLPSGELPPGPWVPLSAWLELRPQPAALAGVVEGRVTLRVERSEVEQPATVLETTVAAFADWATAAAAARLRPLRLAASADGRALLWGTPLPPIPGRRFYDRDGVAAPCGFALAPALEPTVIRALLKLSRSDLVLFQEDGGYELVAAESFTRATRAAARATRDALAAGGVRRE